MQRRFGSRVRVLNCFLEDIEEPLRYDVIVVASLLHHLEDPCGFLGAAGRLLNERGVLLATVPNMTSLHRQLGVKAGALRDVSDATKTNVTFQQPGRFVKASLEALFHRSGYEILESCLYAEAVFQRADGQAGPRLADHRGVVRDRQGNVRISPAISSSGHEWSVTT